MEPYSDLNYGSRTLTSAASETVFRWFKSELAHSVSERFLDTL